MKNSKSNRGAWLGSGPTPEELARFAQPDVAPEAFEDTLAIVRAVRVGDGVRTANNVMRQMVIDQLVQPSQIIEPQQ
jgi:hypothetical protein